jgi:nucleotide-binding universal stress UspA family protein
MTPRGPYDAKALVRICHPSDFSPASEVAFAHALKLALASGAELEIVHVTHHISANESDIHWTDFPGVRRTLARWGVLPLHAKPEDVAKAGLSVRKIVKVGSNPVDSLLDYWDDMPPDLVILATHQRDGLSRIVHRPVAEPLARGARAMTLFVPHDGNGFISLADGSISLRRILIPVDHTPDAQRALEEAFFLAKGFDCPNVEFFLLHVGTERAMPTLFLPHHPGWIWEKQVLAGDPVEGILRKAADWLPDLIVLATEGHVTFLDALRGSTTERVLRGARCSLLAVPAHIH